MNDISAFTKGPQRAPWPVPPAEGAGRRDVAGTVALGWRVPVSNARLRWRSVTAARTGEGAPSLQMGKLSLTEVNRFLREARRHPRRKTDTSPSLHVSPQRDVCGSLTAHRRR